MRLPSLRCKEKAIVFSLYLDKRMQKKVVIFLLALIVVLLLIYFNKL